MGLFSNKFVAFLCFGFLPAVFIFNQVGVALILPKLCSEFHMHAAEQQTFLNIYNVIMSAFLLFGGKLAMSYGSRKVFIWGIVLVILGLLGMVLSKSFPMLILSRAVQGVGMGVAFPLTIILLSDAVEVDQQAKFIGTFIGVNAIYYVIAPSITGFFIQNLSWQGLFIIIIGLLLLCLLTAVFSTEKNKKITSNIAFLPNIILILWLISFIYLLTEWPINGWNNYVNLPLIICIALFGLIFTICEKKSKLSTIKFCFFKSNSYLSGVVSIFCLQMYFALIVYVCLYIQTRMSYSPFVTGIIIMLPYIVALFLSPISASLGKKYGYTLVTFWGVFGLFVGLIMLIISIWLNNIFWFIATMTIFGINYPIVLCNSVNNALFSFPKNQQPEAYGLFCQIRQLSETLGVAVIGAILYYGMRAEGFYIIHSRFLIAVFMTGFIFTCCLIFLVFLGKFGAVNLLKYK